MSDRIIIHADINHCYAQIEEIKNPSLRDVPMAVGGSEEKRHGIILAKNRLASKYNIKTAESLRDAKRKCPELVIVSPKFFDYMDYTTRVKDIYREYSDQVESFGLDEAWVDVSGSTRLFGPGLEIAKTIQRRVYNELGLTISVGVSWNKIFAKLGSDLKKPLGFVDINKNNYKDLVWNEDVGSLLYVGKKTEEKLRKKDIHSIGDLARSDVRTLERLLGKNGLVLWRFANGWDNAAVKRNSEYEAIKSVGNSVTTSKDIENHQDAFLVFQTLAESISSRLRKQGFVAKTVQINFRDTELKSWTRQKTFEYASDQSVEILKTATKLLKNNYHFDLPLRSIGISVRNLSTGEDGVDVQLSFFEQSAENRVLDLAVDQVRERYGHDSIKRCSALLDKELSDFNPQEDHTVHPKSYF